MPRKAPADPNPDAPRRSTRISSQPKEEKAPKTTATSKKRAANESGETDPQGEESKKKVRFRLNSGHSISPEELCAKAKSDKPSPEEESGDVGEGLAPIDIGDALPNLTLKNEKDEDIQVADLASEKGVILFLVPKADTREFIYPKIHFIRSNSFFLSWLYKPSLWLPGYLS